MSNKENLWRLQDEEGQPAAKKPMPKWDAVMKVKLPSGKYLEMGKLQSINFANDIQPIYELGSAMPVHHVINSTAIPASITVSDTVVDATASLARENARRLDERIREQIIHMTQGNLFAGAPEMHHETIEQTIPHIGSEIVHEINEYRYRFYVSPKYISLNREAYRSLWTAIRNNRYRVVAEEEDMFMGIPVICNVTQARSIMVLGSPMQEGIEGRLYNEQS